MMWLKLTLTVATVVAALCSATPFHLGDGHSSAKANAKTDTCCYNDKGYYDPRDVLGFLLTGRGGTCWDGTPATPCCSYAPCHDWCCGCDRPCRMKGADIIPATATTTPALTLLVPLIAMVVVILVVAAVLYSFTAFAG